MVAAQTWRAEQRRLQAEMEKIFEMARDEGATDISGLEAEFRGLEAEYLEKVVQNSCPHTDLPISFYPGSVFMARFPADVVTPLVDEPTRPGGADPQVTEAMDEWPRMFQSKVVELNDEWDRPLGRLEIEDVCDGQEIWGRGSGQCQQKWQEYLKLYGDDMPLAPWERRNR